MRRSAVLLVLGLFALSGFAFLAFAPPRQAQAAAPSCPWLAGPHIVQDQSFRYAICPHVSNRVAVTPAGNYSLSSVNGSLTYVGLNGAEAVSIFAQSVTKGGGAQLSLGATSISYGAQSFSVTQTFLSGSAAEATLTTVYNFTTTGDFLPAEYPAITTSASWVPSQCGNNQCRITYLLAAYRYVQINQVSGLKNSGRSDQLGYDYDTLANTLSSSSGSQSALGSVTGLFMSATANLTQASRVLSISWAKSGLSASVRVGSGAFILNSRPHAGVAALFAPTVTSVDPSLVQDNSGCTVTTATCTISTASNVASGDVVTIDEEINGASDGHITGIADGLSDAWAKVSAVGTTQTAEVWTTVAASSGALSATITRANAVTGSVAYIYEVSGLPTTTPTGNVGSGTGTSFATASTVFGASSFFLTAIVNGGSAGCGTMTAGTSFTIFGASEYWAGTGGASPTTFQMTGSASCTWVEAGAAYPQVVTQPILIATPAGGAPFTYTLSGCSVSITSATSGTTIDPTATPNCSSITVTMPPAGADTRDMFASSSTATVTTCAGPGTCTTFQPSDWYQYKYTTIIYTSKPYSSTLASNNYATITFTQFGNAGTTLNAWDASQATVWADAGGAVSGLSATSSASNSTTRWAEVGFVQINPVSGSGTIAASYYEQESVQFCATVLTGGTAFNSTNYAKAVYKQFNGTSTISPVGSSCQIDWVDWGSAGQTKAGIGLLSSQSKSFERWKTYAANATKVTTHGVVETYQFQDELHSVTVQLKANDETVVHVPSTFTIQGNNGTAMARTSVSLSWASRGTQTLTAVSWEGSNVEPSPAPACTVSTHDSSCAFTVKIYDVAVAFQDAGGTALKVRPSSYTLTFPNSTQLAVQGARTLVLVQAGTTTVASITWEASTLKPTSATTFDASTNQSPAAKFPVYPLDAKYLDSEGYSLGSSDSYVAYSFPNGTAIDYPKSGVGGSNPSWTKWLNLTQVQNGTVSISVYWRAYDVKDASVNLQSSTVTSVSTTVWLNMGGSGTEMYVSTSDAVVNRIWDPNFETLYFKITSTSTTLFMRLWLGARPVPQDVSVDGNLFYSNIPAVWTADASLDMVVLHVQGDIIVDFQGNLASKSTPIGASQPGASFQNIPPSSGQPVASTFQLPDVAGIVRGALTQAAVFFFTTMPYSVAVPFVLLVGLALLLTKPTRGRGTPGGAYHGQVVVVERGRGFSLLLTFVSLSVGAVMTGLSVAFVFPAWGWIPRPTVPWQVLVLVFLLFALVGFMASYLVVSHARSSRGAILGAPEEG